MRKWLALLAMLLLGQGAARADVWAYVNEQGVVHFAAEQLDERYELYFSDAAPEESTRAGPVPLAPTRLHAFFEISPDYKAVRHLLREAAREHGIDYALLQALIATESGFEADAVSPKGAVGLMQLMPATARGYGLVDQKRRPVARQLTDARTNIRIGSLHLARLLKKFPEQPELALAAYNAGLGAVRRAGNEIPPYRETQNYVRTVLALYAVLKPAAEKAQRPWQREPAQVASLEALPD
ncbi:MAG: lytic transglycosylase domain-containing protein [Burkholderiaceae bacterium]|jgi:soluble lytic murein transglycosylase-like protein|nr:lytic transglycosylase domain-containing protein [Burkholderiaceae bacterium]